MTLRPARDEPRHRAVRPSRLIAALGMTGIWILLWGEASVGNLIGGLAVALVVLAIFPLPPLAIGGRIRPLRVLILISRFAWDLIVSSGQVTWAAVMRGPRVRNAVIAVPLRVKTDLNLALTSIALTLIPGSVILYARRDTGTLYIHVLDVKDAGRLDRIRRAVLDQEARIVRAIGSPSEVRSLDIDEAKRGPA